MNDDGRIPETTFGYWKRYFEGSLEDDESRTDTERPARSIVLVIDETFDLDGALSGRKLRIVVQDARAIAGFLRHCYLPDCFGQWLARYEWDPKPKELRSAEDIFEMAERAYESDCSFEVAEMKMGMVALDSAMKMKNKAKCLATIELALGLFENKHIGNGCMWFDVAALGPLKKIKND